MPADLDVHCPHRDNSNTPRDKRLILQQWENSMKLSGLKGETYCMLPQNIGLIILKY
jgi:hypothetical protein